MLDHNLQDAKDLKTAFNIILDMSWQHQLLMVVIALAAIWLIWIFIDAFTKNDGVVGTIPDPDPEPDPDEYTAEAYDEAVADSATTGIDCNPSPGQVREIKNLIEEQAKDPLPSRLVPEDGPGKDTIIGDGPAVSLRGMTNAQLREYARGILKSLADLRESVTQVARAHLQEKELLSEDKEEVIKQVNYFKGQVEDTRKDLFDLEEKHKRCKADKKEMVKQMAKLKDNAASWKRQALGEKGAIPSISDICKRVAAIMGEKHISKSKINKVVGALSEVGHRDPYVFSSMARLGRSRFKKSKLQ